MPTPFAGDLSTAFLTNATLTLTRNCGRGRRCHPRGTPCCADGALREPIYKQSGAASSAWQCALPATGDESLVLLGPGSDSLDAPFMRTPFSAAPSVRPWSTTRTARKCPPLSQGISPQHSPQTLLSHWPETAYAAGCAIPWGPPAALTVRSENPFTSRAARPALLGSVPFQRQVMRVWSCWGLQVTA